MEQQAIPQQKRKVPPESGCFPGAPVIFGGVEPKGWGRLGRKAGCCTLCFAGRLHLPAGGRADPELYVCRGTDKRPRAMTAAACCVFLRIILFPLSIIRKEKRQGGTGYESF